MYLEHFNLKRPPFAATPDPRLFYEGDHYTSILDEMIEAIEAPEYPVVKLMGAPGVGKTMVMSHLRRRLIRQHKLLEIKDQRGMSVNNLLNFILFELELTVLPLDDDEALEVMEKWFKEASIRAHKLVLIMDEADELSSDAIDVLETIAKLEKAAGNNFCSLLMGEELPQGLGDIKLCRLESLPAQYVRDYLNTRLQLAGYEGDALFNDDVAMHIADQSRGVPREINVLADKALHQAFSADSKTLLTPHSDKSEGAAPNNATAKDGWDHDVMDHLEKAEVGHAPIEIADPIMANAFDDELSESNEAAASDDGMVEMDIDDMAVDGVIDDAPVAPPSDEIAAFVAGAISTDQSDLENAPTQEKPSEQNHIVQVGQTDSAEDALAPEPVVPTNTVENKTEAFETDAMGIAQNVADYEPDMPFELEEIKEEKSHTKIWIMVFIAGLLALIAIGALWFLHLNKVDTLDTAAVEITAGSSPYTTPRIQPPSPSPTPKVTEEKPVQAGASSLSLGSEVVGDVDAVIDEIMAKPSVVASPTSSAVTEDATAEAIVEEVVASDPEVAEEATRVSDTEIQAANPSEAVLSVDELMQQAQERLIDWMLAASDEEGTIQLLLVKGGEGSLLNEYLERLSASLDPTEIMVYATQRNGQDYYGVVYKQYASRRDAYRDLKNVESNVPYLGKLISRSVKGIRDEI